MLTRIYVGLKAFSKRSIPVKERHCGLTSTIAGALRLATKYEATNLSKQLRQSLERDWPDDYKQWVVMQEKIHVEKEEYDRATESDTDDTNPGVVFGDVECGEPGEHVIDQQPVSFPVGLTP